MSERRIVSTEGQPSTNLIDPSLPRSDHENVSKPLIASPETTPKRILFHPNHGGDPDDNERYFEALRKSNPRSVDLHPLLYTNALGGDNDPLEVDDPVDSRNDE